MRVVHERCAGLDLHKKTVKACAITPEGEETQTFGTMTADILVLADWLADKGVTHIGMESTGVYWKPLYNLLEGYGFELLLVNAQHIKSVPGRKTDVKDAEWIADLVRHGLVRGSFVPDRAQRELRELVRYRRSVIEERAREVNRVQKVLEGANIKLSSVVTDVMGKSGRAMLEAMVAGVDDPKALAGMARGRLQNKEWELRQALQGKLGPHQRFMLASLLRHIQFLDEEIERLSQEIGERMRPFEQALRNLDTIPGVGRTIAEEIVAETGVDMSRFPSAKHFASWAKVCPGNNESAGKRKTGRTGHGNPWLRSALVEAARAAARTRDTYLSAQYHRIAARRGAKRAAVAVAHTILIIAYHILKNGTQYQEMGATYFDERDKEALVRRVTKRLTALGYEVVLNKAA
jgi:transposase